MLASHRLTVPRRLIPPMLLASHHEMEPADDPAGTLAELERHGLFRNGRLTDEAADVVRVMSEPTLVVSVEVTTTVGRRRSTLWGTDIDAVWGRAVDGDTYELRRLDPIQAPLLVAQLTELGARPDPPFCGGVTVDGAALAEAIDRRGDDPDRAIATLVGSGVAPAWADRLLLAHDLRRAQWSVSSVWTGGLRHHRVAEIEVLDGGAAGYWRISRAGSHLTYTVTGLERILDELRSAIPVAAVPDPH